MRYHPAIVAQAFATLDYLYPDRIFLTVGTGHKLNEAPLGFEWPGYREKVDRLRESLEIIGRLWTGEEVSYEGEYYTLRRAQLYTKPKKKIPLYVATSNIRVAKMAGRMTDGILTNPRGLERYKKIIRSMEEGAEQEGKDPSKLDKCMEFKVAYDVDYDDALSSALYWAPTAIPRKDREHVVHPSEYEDLIGPEEIEKIKESWLITTNSDAIIDRLGEFLSMGFNRVYIHSASPDEHKFLNLLGRDILPWMREYYESVARFVGLAYE
jgi:coenzyme F420-dependent glucose-6-phosphate dehydrogenase